MAADHLLESLVLGILGCLAILGIGRALTRSAMERYRASSYYQGASSG
jgi:hypothetical protein